MLHLVSYKVGEAGRRERVRGLLRAYGWEALPGLFECPVIPAQAGELRARLESLLAEGDEVRIYQVCAGCLRRSWSRGGQPWASRPSQWYFSAGEHDQPENPAAADRPKPSPGPPKGKPQP
jgi:CRISPR-associated endonuclease Cas2